MMAIIHFAFNQAHRHQKPMSSWQKRHFILKMAKAKNAMASGVGRIVMCLLSNRLASNRMFSRKA